jgi:O-antigen/teichoic acid export membrane protein
MSAGDPSVSAGPDVPSQDASLGAVASASARRIVLARLGSLVLVFVGSIILSRTLGPDGRGAHAFFVALTLVLAGALGLGAPTGGYTLSTRHGVPAAALAANAAWLAATSGLLATLATVLLQAVFGFLPAPLADVTTWPVLVAVAVAGFTANVHQVHLALGRGRSIAGAVLSFGPYTIAAIGYLLLPATGGGLPAALWVFALAPYALAVAAALARPRPAVASFGRPRFGLARRSIRQGLRMYPGELAGILHRRSDVLLLGILAPTASLGLYVVAYQSVEPILILASASGATILAIGHGQPEVERGEVTARLIRETLLVGGLLAVAAAVLAPVLVPLVYGPDFTGSVLPLLILLPGIVALACGRIAMADLMRRNMLERMTAILASVMVLNVALNLALIPAFGAVGAAMASLVSYSTHAALAIGHDSRAGGFGVRALVPRRTDVANLLLAWHPRAIYDLALPSRRRR